MMRILYFLRFLGIALSALFFAMPAAGRAAGESSAVQSVEEPDAADDDTGELPPLSGTALPADKPAPQIRPPRSGELNFDKVVLQGLNKVTARAQVLEVPIGTVVRFGTIEIVAHSCWSAPPEEHPENAALLEISEIRQGEPPQRIFLGWMFSSSPGLSALEHPFYDLRVVACGKETEAEKPEKEAEKPAKAAPKK